MKEVDVVLVSWAKDEILRQVTINAIDSLLEELKTDKSITYNVYVVESNKTVNYDYYNDPSFHWGSKNLTVKTIHPDVPFGYHRYLNIGRRAGKSKYVAICNNDLTFESGWASKIIELMEKHPDIKSASPWCPQTQGDNTTHIGKAYLGYRVRGELAGWCIFQQRDIYDVYPNGELNEKFEFWYCDNSYGLDLQLNNIKHVLVCDSVVNHHDKNLGKTGNTLSNIEKEKITTAQHKVFLEVYGNVINKN